MRPLLLSTASPISRYVWLILLGAACERGAEGRAPGANASTTQAGSSADLPAAPSNTGGAGPSPNAVAPSTHLSQDDCLARKRAIDAALREIARCTRDAECTLVAPGCPFGCDRAINRTSDYASVEKSIDAVNAVCPPCMYRCAAPPAGPRCIDGFCKIPRG